MSGKSKQVATADQFEGAVLMRVTERNVKIVSFVDISIDRTLLIVGGDNGAGKTSILDGIEFVFTKKGAPVQGSVRLNPIQNGKQEGSITLEYGDGEKVTLRITKTLKRVGDKDYTAEVDIEIPGYVAPSRVQEFLDELCGKQGADPMAFDRMKPAEQLLALRALVTGFDFDANQAEHDKLFKERTDVGRDRDREQAAANSIDVSEDAPGERVDEAALTIELEAAGKKNLETQQRRTNGERAAQRIADLRAGAADRQTRCDQAVADLERQIVELQARIHKERVSATAEITAAHKEADELQAKLDSAEPLPEEIDAATITAKLNDARRINRAIEDWETQRARKVAHQRKADEHRADYDNKTARLTELEQAKKDAIRKANLPVDGLGFAADHITLKGTPWVEASEADRVDASMAIGMAAEPKLRTILIRHCSGIGTRIRERIRQRAHEKGYRVLMEVYDETGDNSHVFIENGAVKKLDGVPIPAQEPHEPEPLNAPATGDDFALSNEPSSAQSRRRTPRKPWTGPGAPKGDAA